ncbi:MAG: 2-C-methyl-D-erythritol 4-phosphate cytidylyltransferase [Candidatus Dadabacteria bacterium]|nr:2-C-methyl-D-erythritol 4-phosphate cytidylyltransferase [Candidatus Dadabacteria bacterium]NIS07622.1 2-C-methyl-D-erythritol 4-phosphate cytidylyltransferase [Candidatus Dadabacteria bacterium]NIV42076.1 2-C-methyl-D-erythritol 4-phosphate cytidylyltransferase [Candidatus Dadabacteria bacterium]NIX16481.1 2-C-methyl-D-erythritol 4-phosphate cytidylyltransferase [Candidatus Dadabacteria bacterium]NIY21260.1 2-C-methyl-D-erythritol 4-phosphate cytidylyltransferase [Candidatus Dadabacteria ba
MASKSYVCAIIVAGGSGRRFGNTTKKQFVKIGGKPALYYSVNAFENCSAVSEIVLVLPKDDLDFYDSVISKLKEFKKVKKITEGGKSRQDSVNKGLCKVPDTTDIVLVHDAARPLVDTRTINRVIEQTKLSDCAICAAPVNDTVKQTGKDNLIERTVPRDNLWLAQTPQGIRFDLIKQAYQNAADNNISGTDESSLVECLGIKPVIVQGPKHNIKITTPEDIKLAEFYLKEYADV